MNWIKVQGKYLCEVYFTKFKDQQGCLHLQENNTAYNKSIKSSKTTQPKMT